MKPIYHGESLSTQSSSKYFFLENYSRVVCDPGLGTRGFPTALPLTQQTFELVGLNLDLPQPQNGGVVCLICAKCKIIQGKSVYFYLTSFLFQALFLEQGSDIFGVWFSSKISISSTPDHWNSLRLPLNMPLGLFQTLDFFLNLSKDDRGYFLTWG